MNIRTFSVSVQGASHIKKGRICQDASRDYSDDKMSIAVVCDGHGGDDYIRSDIGAELCTGVAIESIKSFLTKMTAKKMFEHKDKWEELLRHLEKCIITRWREAVKEHYKDNPFTDSDLAVVSDKNKKRFEAGRTEIAYGTTMLAIARTDDFWFIMQIGDGKCVAVNQGGELDFPLKKDDPRCVMNATTSMCDSDAINSFRHFLREKIPSAIFIGTDGVDNSFTGKEQLIKLYQTILYSFGTEGYEQALSELKDYLPRLSAKGSGDDISMAAILDLDAIAELDIVKSFDKEKEKERVAQNARIRAEKDAEEKRLAEERFKKQQDIKETEAKEAEPLPKTVTNIESMAEADEISETDEQVAELSEISDAQEKSPEVSEYTDNMEEVAETSETDEQVTEQPEISVSDKESPKTVEKNDMK